MKRVFSLSLVLLAALALTFSVAAGPTIGVRSWPGAILVPSLGLQYAGDNLPIHFGLDVWKVNFWDWVAEGTYVFNPSISVPLRVGAVDTRMVFGAAIPADVGSTPLFPAVFLDFGWWIDGWNGNGLGLDFCTNGRDVWWLSFGARADFHSLIDAVISWFTPVKTDP